MQFILDLTSLKYIYTSNIPFVCMNDNDYDANNWYTLKIRLLSRYWNILKSTLSRLRIT